MMTIFENRDSDCWTCVHLVYITGQLAYCPLGYPGAFDDLNEGVACPFYEQEELEEEND